MKSLLLSFFALFLVSSSWAQDQTLTVKKIMQDPKAYVGTPPSGHFWSQDGARIYFNWNPEKNPGDSLYSVNAQGENLRKEGYRPAEMSARYGVENRTKTQKLYTHTGALRLRDMKSGAERVLFSGIGNVRNYSFSPDGSEAFFVMDNNLFSIDLAQGGISKMTNFVKGSAPKDDKDNKQDVWLRKDQLNHFEILQERKEKRDQRKAFLEGQNNDPAKVYIGKKSIGNLSISPNQRFVSYTLSQRSKNTNTIVPDYVTESGYTKDLNARSKVGGNYSQNELWVLNLITEKATQVNTGNLAGIKKAAGYEKEDHQEPRPINVSGISWSDLGHAAAQATSLDNKDRWIFAIDPETGTVTNLDHQRDEAWIAGPGIGWFSRSTFGWMPDQKQVYFQSEASGYSHLYSINVESKKKTALTKGKFEIYGPALSNDKSKWYLTANKDDNGQRHFYSMPLKGGKLTQLTQEAGNNNVMLSPDEKTMAIIHSYANRPPELYIQQVGSGEIKQVTDSPSDAWKAYNWRVPEFVQFKAEDGTMVPARLYKSANPNADKGPAVVFVHGAGYLQNAHKWWSSYFREYMFHNLLADAGYTVLDIDYRGSAGYGRDWRTGIYQFMGGKDLDDQVDGAKYLVENYNVDAENIGIYGGSYGGFITLMAMFQKPGVFKSGAALRSVTDWAHYNHGYTSRILNTPVQDSIAYMKSSPIYHADGLEGNLLILHGMVDTNVHFQDVVRLAQRLIELEKENWEFAVYPMEGHGFVEPSSWTDEYRRIFKLFEDTLKE